MLVDERRESPGIGGVPEHDRIDDEAAMAPLDFSGESPFFLNIKYNGENLGALRRRGFHEAKQQFQYRLRLDRECWTFPGAPFIKPIFLHSSSPISTPKPRISYSNIWMNF